MKSEEEVQDAKTEKVITENAKVEAPVEEQVEEEGQGSDQKKKKPAKSKGPKSNAAKIQFFLD